MVFDGNLKPVGTRLVVLSPELNQLEFLVCLLLSFGQENLDHSIDEELRFLLRVVEIDKVTESITSSLMSEFESLSLSVILTFSEHEESFVSFSEKLTIFVIESWSHFNSS